MAHGEGGVGPLFGGVRRGASGGTLFLASARPILYRSPPGGGGTLQYALRDVYVALDQALGELLQSVDDNTTVLLVSGDGMGPNYSGSHILNDLLIRMGLLRMQSRQWSVSQERSPRLLENHRQGKTDFLSTLRHLVPASWRIAISQTLLPHHVKEKIEFTLADSRHRVGPDPCVSDRQRQRRLCPHQPERARTPGDGGAWQGIRGDFARRSIRPPKAWINPANGKPAARAVYKTDDIYHGPCRSHMPDIIINWNDEAEVTTELITEKYGLVRSDEPGFALNPYYTGNHRPNAFMLAVGPDISGGAALRVSASWIWLRQSSRYRHRAARLHGRPRVKRAELSPQGQGFIVLARR